MKKDYESMKSEIASALGKASKHYDMSEACFHLRAALSIVEQREKKEARRARSVDESGRMLLPSVSPISPQQAKDALSGIDRMIEEESRRLRGMKTGGEAQQDRTIID